MSVCSWWHPFVWILLLLSNGFTSPFRKKRKRIVTITNTILSLNKYHIKTLQEEFAKKSNIPWIWRFIYGHKLPYMKETGKTKQVCGAACFMAAEIKFSKDVRLSVHPSVVTRQKPPISGSVVLEADESPWRGALLFFEVIHQISRSQGLKNQQF